MLFVGMVVLPTIVYGILYYLGVVEIVRETTWISDRPRTKLSSPLWLTVISGAYTITLLVQRWRNLGANPWLWTALTFVPIFNLYCLFMLYCAPSGKWEGRRFDTAGKVAGALFIATPLLLAALIILAALAFAHKISGQTERGRAALQSYREYSIPASGETLGETAQLPGLPPSTVAPQSSAPSSLPEGTLANEILQRDADLMVRALASSKMGFEIPTSIKPRMVVASPPSGSAGKMRWTEKWSFIASGQSVDVDVFFQEDGAGGCHFQVKVPASSTGLPPPPPSGTTTDMEDIGDIEEALDQPGFLDRKYQFDERKQEKPLQKRNPHPPR
jgi:hypothetical protein